MKPAGLHLLLTYRCLYECDHCFVWGSPSQRGTMTLQEIEHILAQARDLQYITTIYFEGGEPFLYYPILVDAVKKASGMGFQVGIVTNGYWATTLRDACHWLEPFVERIVDLSISSDLYHDVRPMSEQAEFVLQAARELGLPAGVISIPQPGDGQSGLMYRGRAADRLAAGVEGLDWQVYDECPHEDFLSPGRVHIDPFGYIHLCQGICVGNVYQRTLAEIFAGYVIEENPVTHALREGGPAELARVHGLTFKEPFADACHCCYRVREKLRRLYPDILGPDAVYGIY